MLNAGVQGAFQELADNYSHSLALPTEMGLSNKTFISYFLRARIMKTVLL